MCNELPIDRSPATVANLDHDYTCQVLPWLGNATFVPDKRKLSWPQTPVQGTPPSGPTFFVANVQYTRGTQSAVTWRVIGAASRITPTGNLFEIMYPNIPGDRTFEPTATDHSSVDVMAMYQVEALAV